VTPLLVAAGALVGAPLRLFANRWASRNGGDPAAGTLAVNVVGSAVLGVLLGLAAVPGWVLALLGVGFCGALTTFSTFGADVVRLFGNGCSAGRSPTSARRSSAVWARPPPVSGWPVCSDPGRSVGSGAVWGRRQARRPGRTAPSSWSPTGSRSTR
jgi:CrcB protein